jgi:hypothetical protein
MDKTLKKIGAYSILFTMVSGIVAAGVEFKTLKNTVELHERKIEKIDILFKLNCQMAIEVINDKKIIQNICKGEF